MRQLFKAGLRGVQVEDVWGTPSPPRLPHAGPAANLPSATTAALAKSPIILLH